jgi:hypothetical protein
VRLFANCRAIYLQPPQRRKRFPAPTRLLVPRIRETHLSRKHFARTNCLEIQAGTRPLIKDAAGIIRR